MHTFVFCLIFNRIHSITLARTPSSRLSVLTINFFIGTYPLGIPSLLNSAAVVRVLLVFPDREFIYTRSAMV